MEISNLITQINALSDELNDDIKKIGTQMNYDSLKINDISDECTDMDSRIQLLLKRSDRMQGSIDVDKFRDYSQSKSSEKNGTFQDIEEEMKIIDQIEEERAAKVAENTKNDKKEIKVISKKLKEVETLLEENENYTSNSTNDLASVQLHFRKEKIPQ